jgi:hypothetical protein
MTVGRQLKAGWVDADTSQPSLTWNDQRRRG